MKGLKEIAVCSISDDKRGEVVGAAVVLDKKTTLQELKNALRANLSSFKIPRKWLVLDKLSQKRNGKIDKLSIENLFRESVQKGVVFPFLDRLEAMSGTATRF